MACFRYHTNLKSSDRVIPAVIAIVLVCCVNTANGESQSSNPVQLNHLENARTVADLVNRIGREPDRSEQGGACGGILVHDWVSENIRAISLGGSVQAMSALPDSAHTETKKANAASQTVTAK